RTLGPEHEDTLQLEVSRATVAESLGDAPDAERRYREAYEHHVKALGDDVMKTHYAGCYLASFLIQHGRAAEGLPFAEKALEGLRRTAGKNHPVTQYAISVVGEAKSLTGDEAGASRLFEEAMNDAVAREGEDGPTARNMRAHLGWNLRKIDPDRGERLLRAAIAAEEKVTGAASAWTLTFRIWLADFLAAATRRDEAVAEAQ